MGHSILMAYQARSKYNLERSAGARFTLSGVYVLEANVRKSDARMPAGGSNSNVML